jgi:hypothetical protein
MSSRLLELPAELREQIHQYALTEPEGLPWESLFNTQDVQTNQLQLVCRQLYIETAGLELKYNAVTFHQPSSEEEEEIIGERLSIEVRRFAEKTAPSRLHQITSIIFSSPEEEDSEYWEAEPLDDRAPLKLIVDFCNANPHITFKFIVKAWSYRTAREAHAEYRAENDGSRSCSNKDPSHTCGGLVFAPNPTYGFMELTRMHNWIRCWIEHENVQRSQAPNLRFWPAETCIDEQCESELQWAVDEGLMSQQSRDHRLSRFEAWVKEGI